MSDKVEELVRRLVVGRKRDGRKVFDEGAKAELVALGAKSEMSVSKLARECDPNADPTQSLDPRAWAGTPGRSHCKAGGNAQGVRRVAGRNASANLYSLLQ